MFGSSGSRRGLATSTTAVCVATAEPSIEQSSFGVIGEDGRVDSFLTKRESLYEHLVKTKRLLEEVQKLEQSSGTKPKDLIASQSRLRQEITVLSNEWNALNATYNTEMKKRNSKYSRKEMINRGSTLQMLQSEIETVKEKCRAGYTNQNQRRDFWGGGSSSSNDVVVNRYVEISDSQLFKLKPGGHASARNNEMTDAQGDELQVIRERDIKLNEEIGAIGKGIEDLKELAIAQNEEVRAQNEMLDPLREKIEAVHEDMVTTNLRLADALRQMRDGSKLCVDFACVALLIVLCIILYELTKS